MGMLDFNYIIINVLMLIVFVYAGKKVSESEKPWQYIWLCTVSFVFVLGSRYLRGNDYIRYQETFLFDYDSSEVLFTAFNQFLRSIGVTEYTFLYVYSIPFILSGLYFCKRYARLSLFLYPTFLMAFIFFDEYCIRQALGFSFVFLYMGVLFDDGEEDKTKKEKIKRLALLVFFAIMSFSVHTVNMLNVLFITAIYLVFASKTIPFFLSVPSFVFSAVVLSNAIDWSYLENGLLFLGGVNEKFLIYTERTNQFFSSDAFNDEYTRSFFGKIFECIGHCSLFYLGYRTIKEIQPSKSIISLYNVYVLGSIIDRCFWNYELLRRVFDPMLAFWCFVIAFVMTNAKKVEYKFFEKWLFLGLLYFPYELGYKYLVERGRMTLFLWDM